MVCCRQNRKDGEMGMELFRAEKVAEVIHSPQTDSVRKCRFCGGSLELTRKMLDTETGCVIHMYECECGDRTWSDESSTRMLAG